MTFERKDFPQNFTFGVATSSYQIEGNRFGGAGPSIWDKFARDGGVVNHESGDLACDHYHHFERDLDLIRDGGFQAYRFSFSWARILPDGQNVNTLGLDFYDRVIDCALGRGLELFGTAYHWDLPLALGEKGAWTSRDTAKRFADYCALLTDRFGDRLKNLATINEPWCVSYLSYFLGHHAPGEKNIGATAKAMHNILLAHGLGLEAIKETRSELDVGIVLNFEPGFAASDNARDLAATERHNATYNKWFLEAIIHQTYPEAALEALEDYLPETWREDLSIIGQPIDFLGINYYTSKMIAHEDGPFPALKMVDRGLSKTAMDWEITPEALIPLFEYITKHTGDLPLYITENGMASHSKFEDMDRIDYFDQHLDIVAKLAQEKPIMGYFIWSLLDNFEWAFGYEKRFGIIHVDFESQVRTPKASYKRFQKMLK